jgi:hypothetical protein
MSERGDIVTVAVEPNLDHWLPDPVLRIAHQRASSASCEELWDAAQQVRITETGLLGRLIRWRIPGTTASQRFAELFSNPPFIALERGETVLVSGIVGRIWTLRRDYPALTDPEEFRAWSKSGTAKVVFANWASESGLHAEARVAALGSRGRVGLAAVRPLIRSFHGLIGSEGIAAAVRRAESG